MRHQGRNNVAEIRINSVHPSSAAASLADPYYWTEGIKTSKGPADNFSVPGNFGKSVQVDLYLDAAWDGTAVRAGLWTVGDNNAGGTDAGNFPFGIVEFANVSGYKGFRVWDDSIGWKQVPGFTSFGKWVTFNITLDPVADQYQYSINGKQVATSASPAVSKYLYSVLLNQRNFGKDPQAGLSTPSYMVHWQGGIESDDSKDQCKNDGWKNSTSPKFKNQGDCVSHAASKGKAKGNPVLANNPQF